MTHSMMEIIVAVTASLIMVLMVAGGGAAAERMTRTAASANVPAPHEHAPLLCNEST